MLKDHTHIDLDAIAFAQKLKDQNTQGLVVKETGCSNANGSA